MHWNALQKLIWSIFLWSFFDYCSSTAAFSKLFSVVEVCASLQKLTELRSKDDWGTSSGTILLYSRNLSNIVTISAKHQILRYIWRKNKLWYARGTWPNWAPSQSKFIIYSAKFTYFADLKKVAMSGLTKTNTLFGIESKELKGKAQFVFIEQLLIIHSCVFSQEISWIYCIYYAST
jgi:hypothetical protein